jgi:hypothetical protein
MLGIEGDAAFAQQLHQQGHCACCQHSSTAALRCCGWLQAAVFAPEKASVATLIQPAKSPGQACRSGCPAATQKAFQSACVPTWAHLGQQRRRFHRATPFLSHGPFLSCSLLSPLDLGLGPDVFHTGHSSPSLPYPPWQCNGPVDLTILSTRDHGPLGCSPVCCVTFRSAVGHITCTVYILLVLTLYML